MNELDLDRLDDPAAIAAVDASDMLRAIATSAAQVRASHSAALEAPLGRLAPDSRPRAVVVVGMGGSGITGDVLTAVTGPSCVVPVMVHRGYGLPAWVGASDLVVAVSCSGTTQETLSAAHEAARRGARILGVGAAGSPLEDLTERAGGVMVPVVAALSPRSSLWALAVPSLVVAARFGLTSLGEGDRHLEAAAGRLEQAAAACRPDLETFVNPGKGLAAELGGTLPLVWGSGQVGPVAATRTVCQLAENAKLPAVAGALPEAHHNQVVAFDGPLAGGGGDIFRDRVESPEDLRLRLVLVRDDVDEASQQRADVSATVAEARGVGLTELRCEGASPVERLASVVGVLDYASAYLAVATGIDPTPITPIDELKAALSSSGPL